MSPAEVLGSSLVKRVEVLIIVARLGLAARAVELRHRVLRVKILILGSRIRLEAPRLIVRDFSPVGLSVFRNVFSVAHGDELVVRVRVLADFFQRLALPLVHLLTHVLDLRLGFLQGDFQPDVLLLQVDEIVQQPFQPPPAVGDGRVVCVLGAAELLGDVFIAFVLVGGIATLHVLDHPLNLLHETLLPSRFAYIVFGLLHVLQLQLQAFFDRPQDELSLILILILFSLDVVDCLLLLSRTEVVTLWLLLELRIVELHGLLMTATKGISLVVIIDRRPRPILHGMVLLHMLHLILHHANLHFLLLNDLVLLR